MGIKFSEQMTNWTHPISIPCTTEPDHIPSQCFYLKKVLRFFVCFLLCHTPCRTLVHRTGVKSVPPAMEAWIPNHLTAREFPKVLNFNLGHGFLWQREKGRGRKRGDSCIWKDGTLPVLNKYSTPATQTVRWVNKAVFALKIAPRPWYKMTGKWEWMTQCGKVPDLWSQDELV